MKNKYNGIYIALMTPFDEKENINEKVLEAYIKYLLKFDIQGFYVGGSTAEALMMQDEERKNLFKLVKKYTTKDIKLIAHVGSLSTKSAIDMGLYAKELGYDAISAIVPFYYGLSQDEILSYYFDIVSAVKHDMIIYNFSPSGNSPFTLQTFKKLFENEHIVGIKHTSQNLFALNQIKSLGNISIFNGYDELMLAGLSMGATGGIGSTYNIMPQKYIDLYSAFNSGDMEKAKAIQDEICEIITTLIECGVLPSEKYLVSKNGFDMGDCKKPFAKLTADNKKILDKLYEEKLS
ncbi:MAG TPA: N-acetylneuraminate lyase [Clostridiales bacterium]|nr:N-acetylneuraminate lyase [Clostridiales bacterium]